MTPIVFFLGCTSLAAVLLVAAVVVHAIRMGREDTWIAKRDQWEHEYLTSPGWETRPHWTATVPRYDEKVEL